MKKTIFIWSILFVGLTLSGCSKLDEDPASFLVSDQFYQDESQAIAAVTGVYRKLYESGQSTYNRLYQIGVEMATDDYQAGPRARNAHVRAISGLTHDASNDRMQEIWKTAYSAINAANIAIDHIALIDDAKIQPAIRERLINEVKFLRAVHYFNLVRLFGAVPIVLHETSALDKESLQVEKSSEEEVYNQIIADLQDAENLPKTSAYQESDAGRATSGAAKSLLAKVYLTKKDWSNAVSKSKEVIDNEGYDLFDNFADVFAVSEKNGIEHIFSAQFLGNVGYGLNHMLALEAAPNEVPGINGDYADALNKQGGLYESFSANDTRRAVTFVTEMVSPTDGKLYKLSAPHFHKYYDASVIGNQAQSSKNVPIIRYAEVLLIYAEALNEANHGPTPEAYWAIDKVRQRARINKLQDIAPDLSEDNFRDSVFQERRKELVYEYQRWFDLSRRGADYYVKTLKAAGKTAAAPRHIHFPTPQRELDLNPKLKQHPDWVNY